MNFIGLEFSQNDTRQIFVFQCLQLELFIMYIELYSVRFTNEITKWVEKLASWL